MIDQRVHNSIGERFDVELTRHQDPIRRTRRRVCWVVTVVMLVGVALLDWSDDNRIYQARPVAGPHQLFENNCGKCHHTSFHLLKRTIGLDSADFQHSCKQCHAHDAPDHHPLAMKADMADDCATCHKEHQGDADLTRVASQHCVRCHADLSSSVASGETDFSNSISSLADHPEIALLRKGAVQASDHGVHQVARWLDGKWQDRGRLIFNHAVHLDPLGVLIPTDHPDYKPDAEGPARKQMVCASCHQVQDDGAYMKPISFSQHCQQCHQLQFSRQLATIDTSLSGVGPLPHESPQIIRGVLRDRLMDYIEKNPQLVSSPSITPPPRDPAKRLQPPVAKDKWDWVEQRLPAMESLLFASGDLAGTGDLKHACQRCHQTEKLVAANGGVDWKIVPPDVPVRWLRHASFRHDRHDTLITLEGERKFGCTQCHQVSGGGSVGQGGPEAADGLAEFIGSVRAKDILMPSIQVCRKCHGGSLDAVSGSASDRCSECHRYHSAKHLELPQHTALRDYFMESIAKQRPGQ